MAQSKITNKTMLKAVMFMSNLAQGIVFVMTFFFQKLRLIMLIMVKGLIQYRKQYRHH